MAVSWENTGYDFAALVTPGADNDDLKVLLHNFGSQAKTIGMRVWRLDPGSYRVTVGSDANHDDTMDSVSQDFTMELAERGQTVPIELPAQRLHVVEVEQLSSRGVTWTDLTDVALASADVILTPERPVAGETVRADITIHNLGSVTARDIDIAAFGTTLDEGGDLLSSVAVTLLEAPNDLQPKTAQVTLNFVLPTDINPVYFSIQIDPWNKISEITERNNLVVYQNEDLTSPVEIEWIGLGPASQDPPDPDADSDGMLDVWEGEHGLDSSDPSDAGLDNDGDGFTNLAEYEGETDPNDGKVHPYLVVCGLGESASGWSEGLYGDYSQKSWFRVGWSTYNEANGEARVATGDIDGDGKDEVILGLGPVSGNSGVPGGWFEILDDDESRLGWGRVSWSSYNSENGETWPACGDVDGDGVDEIVIGFGSGGAGWFEVFEYGSGTVSHKAWVRVRWSAYGTSDGEVRPACGDVDSDGRDEIVVGLGSSGSGWFEVFDDGEAGYADLGWQRVLWNEYNGINGETRPACGDIDGDGVDEIVIGLGSGSAGWVEVFEYGGQGLAHRDWVRVRYQSYNDANGETRPVCGDIDGDGRDEVVVGLGQGGGGYVAVCDDASQGYGHLAWARVHWQAHNTNNGETWPGVKK